MARVLRLEPGIIEGTIPACQPGVGTVSERVTQGEREIERESLLTSAGTIGRLAEVAAELFGFEGESERVEREEKESRDGEKEREDARKRVKVGGKE